MYKNNILEIVDKGICYGCGTCYSVCPKSAIILKEKNGEDRPFINKNKCNNCGLCLKACGNSIINYDNKVEAKKIMGATISKDVKSKLFNSPKEDKDNSITVKVGKNFFKVGEVIPLLALEGIENGTFKYVVACFGDGIYVKPLLTGRKEDIISYDSAKLFPCALNTVIKSILSSEHFKDILIIGLPCHIRSFKRAEEVLPKLGERIKLYISLTCRGNINLNGVRSVLKGINIEEDEVENISFFKVKNNNMMRVNLKNRKPIKNVKRIGFCNKVKIKFNKFKPLSCMICEENIGIYSDISITDGFINLNKHHKAAQLQNIIIWSDKGLTFIQNSRYIKLREIPIENMKLIDKTFKLSKGRVFMAEKIIGESKNISVMHHFKLKPIDKFKGKATLILYKIIKKI